MLETAAALSRASQEQPRATLMPRVSAAVVLDPWLMGCSDVVYSPATFSSAAVPTLCLMTPSLMFPQNAALVGRAMHSVAEGALPHTVAWVEASGTRHQEASDFVSISYAALRLSCMAGALPPRLSLGRHLAVSIGFLALSGAQRLTGSPQQRRALDLAAALVGDNDSLQPLLPADECYADGCYDSTAFLRHGCK